MRNNYIYILIMAAVILAIRILPMTLFRKPIKSRFIQSFLYYVPYVTLAVMTFPAMIYAPDSLTAGIIALIAGTAAAWLRRPLIEVAAVCCVVVLLSEFLMT